MIKEKGMGRTRMGRFAAITIPAAVATAGLGVAIIQGSVGAVLSSANGFTLASQQIHSDSLKLRAGVADDAAVSGTKVSSLYAETGNATTANKVDILAAANLPVIGAAHVEIGSTDSTVGLPGVILNAKQLGVSDADPATDGTTAANSAATLSNVNLGVAQSTAGFADTSTDPGTTTGYDANGFALTSGAADLNKVNATAYAIKLSGLSVDQLSLSVGLGAGSLTVPGVS